MAREPRPALALFVSLVGSVPVLLVGVVLSAYNGYCEDSVSAEWDAEHCHFHDGFGLGAWLGMVALLAAVVFGSLRLVPRGRFVRGIVIGLPAAGALAVGLVALAFRAAR